MDTQCGFLRTAIGRPSVDSVADIVSYFDQAAQSGSEDATTGAYEAPLTDDQIQQRSIVNVLNNERIGITLQSFYLTPTTTQQQSILAHAQQQIVNNANNINRNEAEMATATAPGGTHEERNKRISAHVATQRQKHHDESTQLAALHDDMAPSTSVPHIQQQQNQQRATNIAYSTITHRRRHHRKQRHRPSLETTMPTDVKHARGNAPSTRAAKYNQTFPGALYNEKSNTNCLIQAIAYLVAFNMILNDECDGTLIPTRARKYKSGRLRTLYNSHTYNRLIGHLLNKWWDITGTRSMPCSLADAKQLMQNCSILHPYVLHIGIVCIY